MRAVGRFPAGQSFFPSYTQRIPFDLRDQAKGLLGMLFGERWFRSILL
jgi:hypothetical protein